MDFSIAPRKV